ncbi:hypothetical protein KZZ52_00450 [Dactylosporangium sp. AC04546]|uniref:hypothetical protein n=1 Tax=Dactylosporangium sp. AC04546 TaxID=2862460 RepID=UPI001EE04ACD|nr:hypothetical protein [Dactylosporangium sp. AC04546]WVK83959.1 hypothetical protein KZZ52_00450 [Dactylosporangium sp. AC04546]
MKQGDRLRAIPLDFEAQVSANASEVKETVRRWPLWTLGLLGGGSVATAIFLDVEVKLGNIVPSVFLEVGAGILLFAVLFVAERRVVRREVQRQTSALIEALTGSATQRANLAQDPDLPDMIDFVAPGGPGDTAQRFLEALATGRYETAWELADDDWRLCRAQAFLWNNRNHFGFDLQRLDELAAEICTGPSKSYAWRAFRSTEQRHYKEVFGDIKAREWGLASRRRRIAPAYELVIMMPLGEHKDGIIVHAPTVVDGAITFVLHETADGYRIASHVAEAPPRPGWPPSWWSRNDPAVTALYSTDESRRVGDSE